MNRENVNLAAPRKTRKGVLGIEQIPNIVISIGIAVFALGLMALFLGTFNASTTDGNATAIISAGLEGLSEFNNWWSLIVIASIFLILFAVLFIFARQARGAGSV